MHGTITCDGSVGNILRNSRGFFKKTPLLLGRSMLSGGSAENMWTTDEDGDYNVACYDITGPDVVFIGMGRKRDASVAGMF